MAVSLFIYCSVYMALIAVSAGNFSSTYEELHWLLLITACILGDECGRSEVALVPPTYGVIRSLFVHAAL